KTVIVRYILFKYVSDMFTFEKNIIVDITIIIVAIPNFIACFIINAIILFEKYIPVSIRQNISQIGLLVRIKHIQNNGINDFFINIFKYLLSKILYFEQHKLYTIGKFKNKKAPKYP